MKNTLTALAGATLLLAYLSAPSLAAPASGDKKVIRMDVKGVPRGGNPSGGGGTFTLRVGGSADRGRDSYAFVTSTGNVYLTGKKGDLVLRLKRRASGLNVDSNGLDLWTGTWSIVSGTRAYEAMHGVGAFVAIIGPSYAVALHLEGFTQPSG